MQSAEYAEAVGRGLMLSGIAAGANAKNAAAIKPTTVARVAITLVSLV
ncbi:hypothetical protein ACFT1A_28385 [Rhodococcus sp. NPDC057135]